jgi:2-polyprenyl-3-methyl-5-hydroxy-6-metoxy-1,4-benzoquinol methylase
LTDTIEGVPYERREQVGCPLCARPHPARRIAVQFGMQASVAECRDCRIAYQTPRPAIEASMAYMDMRWRSNDAYVADADGQRARARRYLDVVASLGVPGRRLLDFGAGVGTFVQAARDDGWDASGVERSTSAIERARRERSIELHADLSAVGDDFDVVTMWDVIEHLRDPQGTVEALRAHLRPGGWVIVETGNWESFGRLATADAWGLYLFDHQYYFSPCSLEETLARAGLRDFRVVGGRRSATPVAPQAASGAEFDAWKAYQDAVARWPEHATIDIMLAAARKA